MMRRLRADLLGLVRSVEEQDWVEERESKEEELVVAYREAIVAVSEWLV